ncbi:MAG: DNA-binding NtrC family response regulator [Myxococcota bacterium]|jgi:DNA-binding NtrC family response regulator
MKFLIVEDDDNQAELITAEFVKTGIEVDRSDSVASAIARVGSRCPYDLIVLDQDLPDGKGFEVQQHLRSVADAPPVIFVTSDDLVEHAVRAMSEGARGYVVKRPNYITQLTKEVSKILSSTRTEPSVTRSEYEERERRRLAEVLERHEWNVSAAARELGMGRGKLRGRMRVLMIDD